MCTCLEISGDFLSSGRAETLWQAALFNVARCGAILLVDSVAGAFVGPVVAILFPVAQFRLGQARSIGAGEHRHGAILAPALRLVEIRQSGVVSFVNVAVVDVRCPLAGLLLDVEVKTGWTSQVGQPAVGAGDDSSAVTGSRDPGIAEELTWHVSGFRIEADLIVESSGIVQAGDQ